jgi:T5SS/PEP-CTERM-associated repeat protein
MLLCSSPSPTPRRLIAALSVATLSLLCVQSDALAQSGPWPPLLGYYWSGDENFSGNGSTSDWAHAWYGGRWQGYAGSPPTYEWLPAQDGDGLTIDNRTLDEELAEHHTVSLSGLHFPNSTLAINLYADYSGGSLEFQTIDIRTISHIASDPHRLNFHGTSMSAELLYMGASGEGLSFDGGQISGSETTLLGGYSFFYPEQHTAPVISFNDVTFDASLLKVVQSTDMQGLFAVDFTDSTLTGLGYEIGFDETNGLNQAAVVKLSGSQATIDQFLLIGSEGGGRLRLENSSMLSAPNAYINVGQQGEGELLLDSSSQAASKLLNVGTAARGSVGINNGSKLTTTTEGKVGILAGKEGTVDIQGGGEWQVKDLTVGENGTGYIFVRDDGTLRVTGSATLGKLSGSRGVLNLIGQDSHLITTQQFIIGDRGAGELNLSEGATYTSQGETTLGDFAGSSGAVTVDGENGPSKWTVTGGLTIGHNSQGRVEILKGGVLDVNGAEVVLGEEAAANGELTIRGENSSVESNGVYVVGKEGKGTLKVEEGATLISKNVIVGWQNSSDSVIEVKASGSSGGATFAASESLRLGEFGKGTLIAEHGFIETNLEAALGAQANGIGIATLSDHSEWLVPEGGNLRVGRDGTGTLNLDSESRLVLRGDLQLGGAGQATGTLSADNQSSVRQVRGTASIGQAGTANVTISGGASWVADFDAKTILGAENHGDGTLKITGQNSKLESRGDLIVGKAAGSTGKIVVESGGVLEKTPFNGDDSRGFILGFEQGATGSVEINQTTIAQPLVVHFGPVLIGRGGKGTMTVKGGQSNNSSTDYRLGVLGTGEGLLEISSQGVGLVANDVAVGEQGKGTLNISDEAYVNLHELTVGSRGTVTVSDDANLRANSDVGVSGQFRVNSGASVDVSGDFVNDGETPQVDAIITGESAAGRSKLTTKTFSSGFSSSGVATEVGGGALLSATERISVDNGSSLKVTGGGNLPSTVSAPVIAVGADSASSITVEQGALLQTTPGANSGVSLMLSSTLSVNGAVAKVHGLLNSSGLISVSDGGRISADRVLIPNGGKVNLAGGTMVVGGSLDDAPAIPANTLLVRANGRMQVNVVGALISNPTIKGKIINGGTFIVGQSPGSVVVDGDFEMQSTGTLEMEIGGLTPGSQFDQILATGAITLGGKLDIALVNVAGGFSLPSVGNQFTMFNAQGGVTGSFTNAAQLNSIARGWRVDWALASSGGSASITAQSVSLQADFNGDGLVNGADLALWRGGMGVSANALHSQGDADGDLDVDGADFLVWQRQFGMSAASALASIPEPNSISLLLIVATASAFRRGCRRGDFASRL